MIILLDQKVKYKFFLPKKFSYFTTNPELGEELSSYRKTSTLNISVFKDRSYYVKVIKLQSDLLKNNLPEKFNPKTVNFNLNFKQTKKEYYSFLQKKLFEKFGENVSQPNNFRKHKSLRLFFFNIIQNLHLPFWSFILIIPSFVNLFRFLLKKNKTLVFASQNHFENIKINFPKPNYFIVSKKVNLKHSINLESLLLLYKLLFFPPLFIKFKYDYQKNELVKKTNYGIPLLFSNYCLFHFAKLISKLTNFKVTSTSNFGMSEAFLNLNKEGVLINHGAHYIDENKLINNLWKFQAQTMIFSKCLTVSTNISDKHFLEYNNFCTNYRLVKNSIREAPQIFPKFESKIILIADTFKVDETLRPFLYNDVNLYIEFIKIILNKAPKNYKVILRHREGTIISKNYIKKIFPSLILSNNKTIYDDFKEDPILISFSSTTLMEARSIGLRTVNLDLFETNLNFMNSINFIELKQLSKRFHIYINSKKELLRFYNFLN